jgi:hypothetical protein
MLDLDLFLELIHQGQLLNQAYNVNKSRCYFTILHNGEIGSEITTLEFIPIAIRSTGACV